MHYHLIGLSVSLRCSAADLLLRQIPFAARSGLMPTSSLAGHPPQPLLSCAVSCCLVPCEVVVVLVRYVSSSMSGSSVLGVCLGSGGPGHPVLGSLHSPSTVEKGYPWGVTLGWFPRPGLPWIPPLRLMVAAPR